MLRLMELLYISQGRYPRKLRPTFLFGRNGNANPYRLNHAYARPIPHMQHGSIVVRDGSHQDLAVCLRSVAQPTLKLVEPNYLGTVHTIYD